MSLFTYTRAGPFIHSSILEVNPIAPLHIGLSLSVICNYVLQEVLELHGFVESRLRKCSFIHACKLHNAVSIVLSSINRYVQVKMQHVA